MLTEEHTPLESINATEDGQLSDSMIKTRHLKEKTAFSQLCGFLTLLSLGHSPFIN